MKNLPLTELDEKLIDLVNATDMKPVFKGHIANAIQIRRNDLEIYNICKDAVDTNHSKNYIGEVIKINDKYAIISTPHDDFAKFRTVNLETGKALSYCSDTVYQQMLVTISYEFEGAGNSQFVYYAAKMLGMEL